MSERPPDTRPLTAPLIDGRITLADRIAGFAAVGATLRATTDAVMRVTVGLHCAPLRPAAAHRLVARIDDLRARLPDDPDAADLLETLEIARSSAGRVAALARRTAAVPVGALAPLGELGGTVADAYHLAVEAWIAAGPHGDRETVVPAHLLDLPCELARATADLDELAAARTRVRAREVLAATDLLLGLGRDAGRLVTMRTALV